MKLKKIKRIIFYLRILFGVSLLYFLLRTISFSRTIYAIKDTVIIFVIVAIFMIGAGLALSAFKLQILARLKNKRITFWQVIRAYYIGFFFNNFIPADIGGDIFKINELRKNSLELKDATTAVIVERFTGSIALIIIALFLTMPAMGMFERFGIAWLRTPFLLSVLILFTSLIVAYLLWRNFLKSYLKQREAHVIWGRLYRLIEGLYVYRDNLKILFQALIISLGFHFLGAVILLSLTASVGNALSFMSLLMVIPILSLMSLLPVSIGALGVKEGTLVFCLTKLGLGAPEALSAALLLRLSIYVHSVIGGLLYNIGRTSS